MNKKVICLITFLILNSSTYMSPSKLFSKNKKFNLTRFKKKHNIAVENCTNNFEVYIEKLGNIALMKTGIQTKENGYTSFSYLKVELLPGFVLQTGGYSICSNNTISAYIIGVTKKKKQLPIEEGTIDMVSALNLGIENGMNIKNKSKFIISSDNGGVEVEVNKNDVIPGSQDHLMLKKDPNLKGAYLDDILRVYICATGTNYIVKNNEVRGFLVYINKETGNAFKLQGNFTIDADFLGKLRMIGCGYNTNEVKYLKNKNQAMKINPVKGDIKDVKRNNNIRYKKQKLLYER